MNYVYYFKNSCNEIIYVGRTNNIKRRMKEHFVRGHLDKQCYEEVVEIMYAKVNDSKYDTEICETLLIDKYKPKYNTEKVFAENFNKTSFNLPELEFKKLYTYFLNDEFYIELNNPKLPCYFEDARLNERCENLINYNIGNLKHRMGLYKSLTTNIYKQHRYLYNIIIEVYEKIKTNICYDHSNVDEPINEANDIYTTYTAFNIDILDNLKLSSKDLSMLIYYGFIFRITDSIYGVPLHTNSVLKEINKKGSV